MARGYWRFRGSSLRYLWLCGGVAKWRTCRMSSGTWVLCGVLLWCPRCLLVIDLVGNSALEMLLLTVEPVLVLVSGISILGLR